MEKFFAGAFGGFLWALKDFGLVKFALSLTLRGPNFRWTFFIDLTFGSDIVKPVFKMLIAML